MARIDDEIKANFKNNKHRFIANLVFTANWFQNLVTEFLKPYRISFQQYNILRILKIADDWVAMNDLKGSMIEKAPNATRLADKLLAKGLVDRKRSDSDRRVVYLTISDKGKDLLKKIDADDNSKYMGFMTKLTDKEARLVSDILDRIRG